ncbi:hypothetical protein ZWY2020_026914 [Hordeum vulgare]|nr:hypothetical protein ZWY2020_026914 [Hordeum vulgare]
MDRMKQIKFMTYNVWCREDVVVYKRMKVIGDHVKEHSPDVIFFQEITPYIHSIFESFAWWEDYHCSPVPTDDQAETRHFCLMLSKIPMKSYARWTFGTSRTGKCYLEAEIRPESMKPITIATTQLECPVPPASMYVRERQMQARHAVSALSSAGNVVFGGDMSWDDDADLPFPLPAGWADAWVELKRGTVREEYSWTYDSFWVEKAVEFNSYTVPNSKKRSDRFVCKLQDYTLKAIHVIEQGDLGIRCTTDFNTRSCHYVTVKASCHRGLLLTIVPK